MQSYQKRDQGGCFRRTQVVSVGRHVAASLNDLADQLVLRQSYGDAVECRPSLAARLSERMAIAALFGLKYESALAFQSSGAVKKLVGNRIATPRVHVRTPWRVPCEMRERAQDYGDQKNRQNSDWPAAPTLFSFSRKKWQQHKKPNCDYEANEESW